MPVSGPFFLSITWTKAPSGYSGTYGAGLVVETSDPLVAGSCGVASVGSGKNKVEVTGNVVKDIFPFGVRKFVRLEVTGG
jgi:hypothetical protein